MRFSTKCVLLGPFLLLLAPMARSAAVGNGVYRVTVATNGLDCGTWTAQTGLLHEAGPGFNVLFGDGVPGTSDTSLRSWSSGETWRTGEAGACTAFCSASSTNVEILRVGGVAVGVRLAWTVADAGGPISVMQEVVVEGPLDGTETAANTVIRETHVVRNLGPGALHYGLRKQWDWQVDLDDGPWLGTCEQPDAACDRSMDMFLDARAGIPQPAAYVINSEPATSACPAGVAPTEPDGCSGTPVYVVAGTVRPPSSLVPPPDAPDLLQFNSWSDLVSTCWAVPAFDNAVCGAGFDDTAIAYFYGFEASTALVLQPGEQRSLVQYVAATTGGCPPFLEPPGPGIACDAGGPHAVPCDGGIVELSGLVLPAATGPIDVLWTTDCPGASITQPSALATHLVLDPGCPDECEVVLELSNGPATARCVAPVRRLASAPVLMAPGDLVVECPAPSEGPTSELGWLASATASGGCGGASVRVREVSRTRGCGGTQVATWELSAADDCGRASAPVERTWRTVDTTPPEIVRNLFDGACAWPPRHDFARLGDPTSAVAVAEACGDVRIEWLGCSSDQPDEAREEGAPENGDGRFPGDCVVSADGRDACVRVERAGNDLAGRRYGLSLLATDACGNSTVVEGQVHVPHDVRGGPPGAAPCERGARR